MYKSLTIYNMKNNTVKHVALTTEIGMNSIAVLINSDLNIIGGNNNKFHIMYNLLTNKSSTIHSFPFIISQGLIYNESTKT